MKQIFIVLVFFISAVANAQPSADILNYINNYKQLAIEEMNRTGVPASIKLAQGIHETFAGKSVLVLKSNNHFGIKCKTNWSGEKVYHDDDARGECFRSYPSSTDSYRDHSDFLRNGQRYAFLFELDPEDYQGWAYGLKKAGYATNIRYSHILIRLIEEYQLQQFTLIALGKASPSSEMFVKNNVPSNQAPATLSVSLPAHVEDLVPPVDYPAGQFTINHAKVIFAEAGSSLLSIANEYNIPYSRLLDFNDMKDVDILGRGQLIFLQRKRKVGSNEIHIVKRGESLYDIAQVEGIRLESVADLNLLEAGMNPAEGEQIQLIRKAASRPRIVGEVAAIQEETMRDYVSATQARHVVQTKETLYSISKKYGVQIDQLRAWNQLNGTDLKIGQELVILKN